MQWASPSACQPWYFCPCSGQHWNPVPNLSHFFTEVLHPVTHQIFLILTSRYILCLSLFSISLSIIFYLDNCKSLISGFLPQSQSHLLENANVILSLVCLRPFNGFPLSTSQHGPSGLHLLNPTFLSIFFFNFPSCNLCCRKTKLFVVIPNLTLLLAFHLLVQAVHQV